MSRELFSGLAKLIDGQWVTLDFARRIKWRHITVALLSPTSGYTLIRDVYGDGLLLADGLYYLTAFTGGFCQYDFHRNEPVLVGFDGNAIALDPFVDSTVEHDVMSYNGDTYLCIPAWLSRNL